MCGRSGISEWGEGKPFAFAIDHQFARRRFIIDGDRDNNGLLAFGLRSQDLEGTDFPVVAVLAPVVQEILVSVRGAGLPKPVGFRVVALLQRGEKARDGAFLRVIANKDVALPRRR